MDAAAPTPSAVCATCKGRIAAGSPRLRCSVSACNAGRIKLRFCSVECWRAHVPTARHRRASYVEERPAEVGPDRGLSPAAQPTSAS